MSADQFAVVCKVLLALGAIGVFAVLWLWLIKLERAPKRFDADDDKLAPIDLTKQPPKD